MPSRKRELLDRPRLEQLREAEGPPPLDVPRNVICMFLAMVRVLGLAVNLCERQQSHQDHVHDIGLIPIKGNYISTVELGGWLSFLVVVVIVRLFVSVSSILLQLLLFLIAQS